MEELNELLGRLLSIQENRRTLPERQTVYTQGIAYGQDLMLDTVIDMVSDRISNA